MRLNFIRPASFLLVPLALTACTTIDTTPPPVVIPAPAVTEEIPRHSEAVIENLVTQANQRRYTPLVAPTPPDENVVEPVTTVVPMTANRVVERAINDFLQNRRSVLQSWIGRAQTYFPMIEQIFAEEGVPDELKYLALGESGLNPTAGSWAGAVGMWQFMAATARGEGLRVDSWVDERRDPELSTHAAAHHLKTLHEDYNGLWHLALAGYNCSYRCITHAVENAGGSMEDPPSYWDIYPFLPRETREFVPHYIAAALIVSHPDFYGIPVEDLGQELAYDRVWVQGMLRLEDAARFAGTDVPSIKRLNPSLLRNTLPNDAEPFPLRIPLGTYDRFVASLVSAQPHDVSEAGAYVVKNGDTLGKIALNYKVRVDEIQAVNSLKGTLINVGQKLRIPGQGPGAEIKVTNREREFVAYGKPEPKPIRLGDEFELVQQSGSTADKPLLAVRLTISDEDEGALDLVPTIYKVRRGDTLGTIAKRYRVSVASIQETNNIKGNMIFADQELTIHSATSREVGPSATLRATTAQQSNVRSYEVQSGDSLYVIARKFGVSVDSLRQLNRLPNDLIRAGQSLLVN